MDIFQTRHGLILVLTLGLSGCHPNLTQYAGTYTGSVSVSSRGGSLREPMTVTATSDDEKHLVLDGTSSSGHSQWAVRLVPGLSPIELTSHGLVEFAGRLHKSPRSSCYESKKSSDGYAKLCMAAGASVIQIEAFNRSVTLDLDSASGVLPVLESPRSYSLADLKDRARRRSFSSRAEFEKLVSARLNVRLRYLNLLPHFSTGSAVAIATFSGIPGLLTAIGDLAPFLLPSRWIAARESKYFAKAQEYAVEAMQLDSAQIVEGLGLVIGRDQVLRDQLKKERQAQEQIMNEVLKVEQEGRIAQGASIAFLAEMNGVDQTISSLESQIALEMTDLAQAAGLMNPSAISSLNVSLLGDIKNPPSLNLTMLEKETMRSAPELEQLEALLLAARLDTASRGFQWLDPAGDPSGGIGVGLPTYIEIGKSSMRQLKISRDQLDSTLLRKITDAYNDYLGWIDSYKLAQEGVELQAKRISYARQALQTASAPSAVEELREAIGHLGGDHVNMITAEYAWNVSVSRVARLARRGAYE